MRQKDSFLTSEGNAWFKRNTDLLAARRYPDDDPLCKWAIDYLPTAELSGKEILEIGCSDGGRLAFLRDRFGARVQGIDPSAEAVDHARARGVQAVQGTADDLPFAASAFDMVIFGFSLYLCDRSDLFTIAREADRVLRAPGWVAMLDFFSEVPRSVDYRHMPGLKSFKMDYRRLFDWHPSYSCLLHRIGHHATGAFTDSKDEWIAVSLLRKGRVE